MNRFRMPPLFDHHSHFSLYAALHSMPSLADVPGRNRALDLIRGSIRDTVTVIPGWNSSKFSLTPQDIEHDLPVIVLNLSLHGMVMNRAAEIYLSRDFSDIVDNHNNPLWMERNIPRTFAMTAGLSAPSAGDIKSFAASLADAGIAAMEDMLLPGPEWLSLVQDLPVRVEFRADEAVYEKLTPSDRLKVKGVKLFTDGALGSKSAALSRPFITGEKGILLMEDDALAGRLYGYMSKSIPLAIHAIGDLATEQAVRLVSGLRREAGCTGPVRVEHAQFITRDTALAAKDAGITLCMQPNFSFDSTMYADRLPRGYPEINNPFRMLIDEAGFLPGRDLLFGSDGMPHGIIPALQAALFPPYPGQVLTLSEFKDGYCLPGAEEEWGVEINDKAISAFPS